jgi:hypothetical protein
MALYFATIRACETRVDSLVVTELPQRLFFDQPPKSFVMSRSHPIAAAMSATTTAAIAMRSTRRV